tara:strand:+ start:34519 stop:36921 length:2403 start_codon:yes stop_codon:yes gene_type:complete
MKKIIALLLLLSSSFVFAQNEFDCYHFDERGQTREHFVDFKSMLLDISFDTKARKVLGQVHYDFTTIRPLIDHLVLDAPEILIEAVLFDGTPVEYATDEEHLIIYFPASLPWEESHQLDITYSCQPEKGLYFLGWKDTTNRARKQIWTQGQGIDNRYWVPSFDDVSDKLITETIITFDSKFEVVSNGDLIGKEDHENGMSTWHYKMKDAHVPYLLMIAIGEYDFKDMISSSGIVNRQYYYPNKPEEFKHTYMYSVEMMDWMEEEFQVPYPWGKIYRNVPVADFLYGAMENTTSTIFTDYYLKDSREALDRTYVGTNAHELTHQWFGDLISEWNGASHWLHESFATHYAKHFERSVFGEDYFQWERNMEMRRAMSADDKNDLPIAHSESGSSRHYPKGSFVIDMLREAAGGDEAYKKVINAYLKKYAFKHVDTHLFQLEFMEVLGLNLDWFFDQWVRKGGYPIFECDYTESAGQVKINISQIHDQSETIGLFKVQMPIQIRFADGTDTLFNASIDSQETTLSISNTLGKSIQYVLFNVNHALYAKIEQEKTTAELLAQALEAKDMIDRYLALAELEDRPLKEKRNILLACFENESFFAPRANIVKQLANDNNSKSQELIMKSLLDNDARVRRAVVYHLEKVSKKIQPVCENLLLDSSYANIKMTLEKLIEEFPESKEKYLKITHLDAQKNDLLNIAHLSFKAQDDDSFAFSDLIDYAGPSFEFRTRIKAIEALTDLAYQGDDFTFLLIDASVNFNRRLAGVASNVLMSIENQDLLIEALEKGDFDKNERKRIEQLKTKLGI